MIESRRVAEQIQMMVDQGVYGAFVFPIDGLRTPYLTDAWFKALGGRMIEAGTGISAMERVYDQALDVYLVRMSGGQQRYY